MPQVQPKARMTHIEHLRHLKRAVETGWRGIDQIGELENMISERHGDRYDVEVGLAAWLLQCNVYDGRRPPGTGYFPISARLRGRPAKEAAEFVERTIRRHDHPVREGCCDGHDSHRVLMMPHVEATERIRRLEAIGLEPD